MRVLCTLELGGNLGHVARLRPLLEGVRARNADVAALAIQHETAREHLPCQVHPAPWDRPPRRGSPPWIGHLGDTLAALGWDDLPFLERSALAWRDAILNQQPDALLLDASPTALLAASGLGLPTFQVNDAFGIPPAVQTLPDLLVRLGRVARRTAPDPTPRVLDHLNTIRERFGASPCPTLGDFITSADRTFLNHPPELDLYGPRHRITCAGPWGGLGGAAPDWPAGEGPRVLVYLRHFEQWPVFWKMLEAAGLPTIAAVGPDAAPVPNAPHLHVCRHPVDLASLTASCDLAIGHGGVGFTGQAIVAGKPLLLIPQTLEQSAYAQQASRLGVARVSVGRVVAELAEALRALLMDEALTRHAAELGRRHAGFDPRATAASLAQRIVAG